MIAQASQFASPTASEVLAHALFYVGVVALIGAGVAGRLVFTRPPFALARLTPLAWSLAAAGAGAITILRAQGVTDAGVFLGSPLGRAALVRGAGLLAAYVAMLVALRDGSDRRRRGAFAVVVLAAVVAAFGHTLSSHAGVGGGAPFKLLVQTAHIAAVGAWLGGLAFTLAGVGRSGAEAGAAVARFSSVAGVGIAVVAATGALRSLNEIGGVMPLVETTYGRIALAKIDFLLLLAIFGAVNRYRYVPAAATSTRMLRRLGVAELGIAVVVLGLTGMLAGTAPAREAYAARDEFPVRTPVSTRVAGLPTVHEVSLGDGRKVQVYLDPDRLGTAEAHVTLFGPDGGELAADSVAASIVRGGRFLEEPRRFGEGHFVLQASITDRNVTVRLEIRPRAGGRLRAEFTIAVG